MQKYNSLNILIIIANCYCCCMFMGCKADLLYHGQAIHPDHPDKCYYEDMKQLIPINQTFKPINRDGHCVSVHCRSDYVIEIGYCGRHNMIETDECSIVTDMTKPFPACCPHYVCKQDNFVKK